MDITLDTIFWMQAGAFLFISYGIYLLDKEMRETNQEILRRLRWVTTAPRREWIDEYFEVRQEQHRIMACSSSTDEEKERASDTMLSWDYEFEERIGCSYEKLGTYRWNL